jgi:hypothetical protein
MAKKLRTPGSTPYRTLAKEMMFSYIQTKAGMHKLARMMKMAKDQGIIKTPRQFRLWVVDEVCKSVDVIEQWMQSKQPQ